MDLRTSKAYEEFRAEVTAFLAERGLGLPRDSAAQRSG